MHNDHPHKAHAPNPHIWIDADACPIAVREIVIRAIRRTGLPATFVANHVLPLPKLPNLRFQRVAAGFDVADNLIAREVRPGDLVITQDIPLAAEVIEKGAAALGPRGEWHTAETIRQRLNMRDFMETLRASGIHTGGSAAFGVREKQAFANHLDRWLARHARGD